MVEDLASFIIIVCLEATSWKLEKEWIHWKDQWKGMGVNL
jgi:hypothetical protein